MSGPMIKLDRRARFSVLLSQIVLVGGVVYWLLDAKRQGKFALAAPDTFYYLTVARNIVEHGLVSFDGEHPTNGFHPIWQLLTTMVYGISHLTGAPLDVPIVGLLLLGAAMVAGALWLLARAFCSEEGALPVWWPLMPVGVVGLIEGFWFRWGPGWQTRHGTLWTYINGMESAAVLLFYAAMAYAYVRWEPRRSSQGALFGLLCLGLTLSRLDHAIIPFLLLAGHVIAGFRSEDRSVDTGSYWRTAGATWALGLLLYFAINLAYADAALPASGKLKTTLPLTTNGSMNNLLRLLEDPKSLGRTRTQRLVQLLLPLLAVVAWWAHRTKLSVRQSSISLRLAGIPDRRDVFLLFTGAGIVVLAVYNFYFTKPGDQGQWYMPVAVLFVSLVCVRWSQDLSWRLNGALGYSICAGTAVLAVLFFARLTYTPERGRHASHFFYDLAPGALEFYRGRNVKLVSSDDGIIAYRLGMPTMSGIGLALDQEAIERIGDQRRDPFPRLYDLALERGFDRITSYLYTDAKYRNRPIGENPTSGDLKRFFRLIGGDTLRDHDLVLEYRSDDGRLVIARVVRDPT